MTQTTSTIDKAEAKYDKTSEALRNAAPSDRAEALAAFEEAIEELREVRQAATNW